MKVTRLAYRVCLLVVVILLTGIASSCTHRLYAPMQPDGWSAQPIVNACRFAPDADLDPATGTPVGDEGYYLYILTDAAKWDFSKARSILFYNLAASDGRIAGSCWKVPGNVSNSATPVTWGG